MSEEDERRRDALIHKLLHVSALLVLRVGLLVLLVFHILPDLLKLVVCTAQKYNETNTGR